MWWQENEPGKAENEKVLLDIVFFQRVVPTTPRKINGKNYVKIDYQFCDLKIFVI